MGFRFVPKSVTLNDLEQRNGRYFALFYRIRQLWASYVKVLKETPILSATKNVVQRIWFLKQYMTYGDILTGF